MSKDVPSHIIWLSKGPDLVCKKYAGYAINGYQFRTRKRDNKCRTQNSGVTLAALTPSFASSKDRNPIIGDVSYYGAIEDIIEVNYSGQCSVILFRCTWFQEEKDKFGLLKVNFNRHCYSEDPYVMANQVHQIFYIKDPTDIGCHYVIRNVPRDVFDMVEENNVNIQDNFWGELNDVGCNPSTSIDEISGTFHREDLPGMVVDVPTSSSNDLIDDATYTDDSDFDDTGFDWME